MMKHGSGMRKILYLFCVLCFTILSFAACAKRDNHRNSIHDVYLYTDKFSEPQDDNYGYSAKLESDGYNAKIYISAKDGSIQETVIHVDAGFVDSYAERLFLDMKDDGFGVLLSGGSPGAGTMGKMLYITEDGWSTYEAVDISSQIKPYPRHIAMLSREIGYIGGDRRDASTLYRTVDGGRTWSEVAIGNNTRNAFAPIEGEDGKYYELIEIMTDESEKSAYNLYESYDGLEWERLKNFSLNSDISGYYYADGRIYFVCRDGIVYAMEL